MRLLTGGSPCTHWSIAQKNNRETKAEGLGWELFKNFLIAKEKFQPDYFLYENNKSAAKPIKDQIAEELGVELQYINSALVSAQNRQRFYAHNIPDVPQPEDKGILLKDILENGITYQDKAYCLTASYNGAVFWNTLQRKQRTMVLNTIRLGHLNKGGQGDRIYSVEGKSICLSANGGGRGAKTGLYRVDLPNGDYLVRKLTPLECERLQTMPDGYTDKGISDTQRYKCLGNGWTAEVIKHILSYIPYDGEPVEVLSMYDGIATGYYCMDSMGWNITKYKAYEIDKYPMQVAQANYPNIIQCGDAFKVREDNWVY